LSGSLEHTIQQPVDVSCSSCGDAFPARKEDGVEHRRTGKPIRASRRTARSLQHSPARDAGSYVAIKVGRLVFLTFDTSAADTIRTARAGRLLIWFVTSGGLWLAGGLAEGSARTTLWIVALAIDLTGPLVMYWVPGRHRLPYDAWTVKRSHFAERFELFMIIAFGETIVLTGATTSELELDAARFTAFALAFLGTAALWWLYFDGFPTIAKRRLELAPNGSQLVGDAYMYLHVVFVAGVIHSAVGDSS
jgi:low temperature requirement protein LtrA